VDWLIDHQTMKQSKKPIKKPINPKPIQR